MTGRRDRWEVTSLPGDAQTLAATRSPNQGCVAVPQGGWSHLRGWLRGPAHTLCPLTYQESSLPTLITCHLHSQVLGHPRGYPDPKCFKNKQASRDTQARIERAANPLLCSLRLVLPEKTRATPDEERGQLGEGSPAPASPCFLGLGSGPGLVEEGCGASGEGHTGPECPGDRGPVSCLVTCFAPGGSPWGTC